MRPIDVQRDWDAASLRGDWPTSLDWHIFFAAYREAMAAATAVAAPPGGRVLEVASADAVHARRLAMLGFELHVLEPSPAMVAAAARFSRAEGAVLSLVRGIGEALPYADATFDRVLCDSALDHMADPEAAIREIARVVRPDGRAVITFVNYGAIGVRASRLVYRVARTLRLMPRPSLEDGYFRNRQFWDTPVPVEHTFECTFRNVLAMCEPFFELDVARGLSLGLGFPGWGWLLDHRRRAQRLLRRLNAHAAEHPGRSEFVIATWRPRAPRLWPVSDCVVRPTNPVYQREIVEEADYWARRDFAALFADSERWMRPYHNRELTGDPARSWVADLATRGPFRDVAVLTCDDARWDREWLERDPDARLQVYELSPYVTRRVARQLGRHARRVRFEHVDLNFAELPVERYDLIWSSGGFHCLVNLEHVLNQVARALRPGGTFVLHGWVGERRMQFDAAQLERATALLGEIPARYRRVERITPAESWVLSPFRGVRSNEILPLVHERFDVVLERLTGRMYPLAMAVDLDAIQRDDPALLERVLGVEAAARDDATLRPTVVYGVYRRRGPEPPLTFTPRRQ